MSEFKSFDDRLNGLITALTQVARRNLAGEVANELRKSQQQRIKQQNLGWLTISGAKGSAAQRKGRADSTGAVSEITHVPLPNSQWAQCAAVVEFTCKVQRIEQIHQLDLKDQPNANSRSVQYPERQLHGFSRNHMISIEHFFLNRLEEVVSIKG